MKTFNSLTPPKGYLCVRCEAKGDQTQAEVFVEIDGLLDSDMHPLCLRCKKEWEIEYNSIMNNEDDAL